MENFAYSTTSHVAKFMAFIVMDSITHPTHTDLLHTKFLPPRLPASVVTRQEGVARLDACLAHRLTVITAPAGFGKTTLTAQWRHHRPETPVAWLSLDADDSDAVRFWHYVIGACGAFGADIGTSALARLTANPTLPFAPPDLEPVVTALLNDLATLTKDSVLVLEDYHFITDSRAHDAFTVLIDHLPPTVHLVLLTRHEPPLPLARWRARGLLAEIDATTLRFSPTETADFLARFASVPLSADAITHLYTRTDGWAAGLRLAALSLQRCRTEAETAQAIASFSGRERAVVDYLVSDVLATYPAVLQEFLLVTAILPSLTATLCDTVTGNTNSTELLGDLEHANLFILPLDDAHKWYRYHALFAEALRAEAQRRFDSETLHRYYLRASIWYEQHGQTPNAVDAALDAEDGERAATLIERWVEPSIIHAAFKAPEDPALLRRWMDRISDDVLADHPLLCFTYLIVLRHTTFGALQPILPRLETIADMAEAGWQRNGDTRRLGWLYAARALFALWTRRMHLAISWSQQALALLPAEDAPWRGICLGFAGAGALRSGNLRAARPLLEEAKSYSDATHNLPASSAHGMMLAELYEAQSELTLANAFYQQALHDKYDPDNMGDHRRSRLGSIRLGLGRLAYERDDLDTAEMEANATLQHGILATDDLLQVQAISLRVRIATARGQFAEAHRDLATLLARYSPHQHPGLYRETLAVRTRLFLTEGNVEAAQAWYATYQAQDLSLSIPQQEQEALLIARLRIAEGTIPVALKILDDAYPIALNAGRLHIAMEIQLLRSLVFAAANDVNAALTPLQEILRHAQRNGLWRFLLDEGAPLADLLRVALPALPDTLRPFAQSLLQGLVVDRATVSDAPLLSVQEQKVLQVLATGYTTAEIAQHLIVSVNTIKTQLRHIYRKLGVTSRDEACAVARQLAII